MPNPSELERQTEQIPMTDADITGIESRCAAATPGPWVWDVELPKRAPEGFVELTSGGYYVLTSELDSNGMPFILGSPADFSFVAHSRTDLPRMLAEVQRLRAAIAEHHGQKADDRCIGDDDRLYQAAGLSPCDRRVGDQAAMLENCRRFIEQRTEGGGWPTYRELEKERDQLRVKVQRILATDQARFLAHAYLPATWEYDVIQVVKEKEREACIAELLQLEKTVSDWADTDGPESVAAIKSSTYHNSIERLRNRGKEEI